MATSYGDLDGNSSVSVAVEATQSRKGKLGTWKHAAFHIATTIATPAAYAPLPFALASLGWSLGVTSLVVGTLATWYSSILITSLWGWNGKKQTTYRSLGQSIFGSWGFWSIATFQQVASLGNNIAIHIAAGISIKAIYKHFYAEGPMTLQHFIIIFGVLELILSQFPDIHSLRWVNAICTASTIGFAATAIGVTIYNGEKLDRTTISHKLEGSYSTKLFKAFNALGAIAFSFGNAMLPEIQDSVREPAKKNMFKGISAAYGVIIVSYWLLATLGYWAFGSNVQSYILSSLETPNWSIILANIFAVIQIAGCFQIYCRPTYSYFNDRLSSRNPKSKVQTYVVRFALSSCYMGIITLIAAAIPFFGDFVSICGAIGFTPLDFVFPVIAYLKAGTLPKDLTLRSIMILVHLIIAVWYSIVSVLGCVGAIKFIIEDVNTYKFFHDL